MLVEAASIRVTATLVLPSSSDANDAVQKLRATPVAEMQGAWFATVGVTLEGPPAISEPRVTGGIPPVSLDEAGSGIGAVAAAQEANYGTEDGSWFTGALIGGVAATLLLGAVGGAIYMLLKKKMGRLEVRHSSKAVAAASTRGRDLDGVHERPDAGSDGLETGVDAARASGAKFDHEFDVIFGDGPLGLGLVAKQGLTVVGKLDTEEAANKGVGVGDVVSAVAGQSTAGLEYTAVAGLIRASSRPLTLTFVTRRTRNRLTF